MPFGLFVAGESMAATIDVHYALAIDRNPQNRPPDTGMNDSMCALGCLPGRKVMQCQDGSSRFERRHRDSRTFGALPFFCYF
jgi:hypothetical protein